MICAYDGVEALEKVKAENPDLIVLDIIMPRMDGYEVLKHLHADPRYQNIPVVMLACKAQDADIFKAWALGCSSYVTKPWTPQELLVFVERIFETLDEPNELEEE